jgi:hypothetical protein
MGAKRTRTASEKGHEPPLNGNARRFGLGDRPALRLKGESRPGNCSANVRRTKIVEVAVLRHDADCGNVNAADRQGRHSMGAKIANLGALLL